jgi:hypothetical protein
MPFPVQFAVDSPESGERDLTNVSLGKMIQVCLFLTEVAMFRISIKPLTLVLIAAMSLAGVVPASGTCEVTGRERGAKQCCGVCCTPATPASHSCCAKTVQTQACQCTVEQERPTAPQEPRTSGEQTQVRLVKCLATVLFVADEQSPIQAIEDASLQSRTPKLRRQTLLCRWLV